MVLVEKIEKEKPTNVGTQTSTSAVCTFPEKRRYYLLAMANSLENEKSNLIKQMIKRYQSIKDRSWQGPSPKNYHGFPVECIFAVTSRQTITPTSTKDSRNHGNGNKRQSTRDCQMCLVKHPTVCTFRNTTCQHCGQPNPNTISRSVADR